MIKYKKVPSIKSEYKNRVRVIRYPILLSPECLKQLKTIINDTPRQNTNR